jgi:hypothetical protein
MDVVDADETVEVAEFVAAPRGAIVAKRRATKKDTIVEKADGFWKTAPLANKTLSSYTSGSKSRKFVKLALVSLFVTQRRKDSFLSSSCLAATTTTRRSVCTVPQVSDVGTLRTNE